MAENNYSLIKKIFKIILYFLLPIFFVVYLFWPLYQNIPIEDSEWLIDQEMPVQNSGGIKIQKALKFPVDEEYFGYLPVYVPIIRHKLCFSNNNNIYLKHSDSNSVGFPFFSPDLSNLPEIQKDKVGAMTIALSYSNSGSNDTFYREIGQSFCDNFNLRKVEYLTSSTIEYRHLSLREKEEFVFPNTATATLNRIVGNTYIATNKSSASIRARWSYLIIILLILWIPGIRQFWSWLRIKNHKVINAE